MKTHLKYTILFFVFCTSCFGQYSLYRSYVPQNPLPLNYTFYNDADIHAPVQTADKGYILGFRPYSPNIHWAYPEDFYVIKTDSNLVPQWKYPYFCRSVALPTGGILLFWNNGFFGLNGYQSTFIQKVTASGTTVWTKEISGDTQINDGVSYGDKVRFVGSQIAFVSNFPLPTGIYAGFSMEIDTLGNVTSSRTFNFASNNYFERITRAANGDFFISSSGEFTLLKFDPAFNMVWASLVPQGSTQISINKIITLSNGDLLATGKGAFSTMFGGASTASIFRISAAGQIQALKYIPNHYTISDLCRNAQGKFVGTFRDLPNDSLQIFEMDSLLNILSVKLLKKGKAIGGPARTSTGLVIPFFDADPKVLTTTNSGATCYTMPGLGPFVTATASLAPGTCTSIQASFSFSNSIPYGIAQQNYSDTCKCNNLVTTIGSQVCSGSTASVQASAFGVVNWYATPSGGSALSSGNTYFFTASTGPQQVLYAAAATCGIMRTPATVSVLASPQIQVVADKTIMCVGEIASISVAAVSTVTWAPTYSTVTIYTTSATGTGSLFYSATAPNGCSGVGSIKILGDLCTQLTLEETNNLHVFPNPTNDLLYSSDATNDTKYQLSTLAGALLQSGTLSETQPIDLRELPSGIYLLRIAGYKTIKVLKTE